MQDEDEVVLEHVIKNENQEAEDGSEADYEVTLQISVVDFTELEH